MTKVISIGFLLLCTVAALGGCGGESTYEGNSEYKLIMTSPTVQTITLSEKLSVKIIDEGENVALKLRPDCQVPGRGTETGGTIMGSVSCQIAIDPGNNFAAVLVSGNWFVKSEQQSSGDGCTTTDDTLSIHVDGTFSGNIQSNSASGALVLSFTGHRTVTHCSRNGLCGGLNGLSCG